MTKVVMVRCYLLCLLTLTLCCACGLVWADSPKASDALIKPSTVGVPSLVYHAFPAQDVDGYEILIEEEEEDGDHSGVTKVHGSESSSDSSQVEPVKQQISPPSGSSNSRTDLGANRPGLSRDPGSAVNRSPDEQNSQMGSGHEKTQEEDQLTRSPEKEGDPSKEEKVTAGQTETSPERVSNIGGQGGSQLPELPEQQQEQQQGGTTQDSHTTTNTVDTTKGKGSTDSNRTSVAPTDKTSEISPNNSEVKNADGSDAANTESDVTPSGSVSSNNQEGDAVNTENTTTTTTTTTTTLPPELTNNKKGDADSSSSISSSVWVRVPLLIVVTLACILVC
ncbi:uncharacterized protein TM35_000471340 [Trypanosoma theileri]|uniref:Mucin-associated surface protein (MASP) n=1 Tax=Trypanosoma theileri TaxID=67003 RepID=A0A1X0NJ76_9TRYP|nr:uncharacterized protein TM35_000471340 [Trypanosoma theileri]ORC84239.1 hypothetical protein TM35_000471340 [Trypanosoma theileri]